MIVVSDTSPVTNLFKINQLEILQKVFGIVILPTAVYDELCHLPEQKVWIDQQTWMFVQNPKDTQLVHKLEDDLDEGEAEAIALALELKADYLIIDELKGREKAEEMGLKIVGLLGTLILAKNKGVISAVRPLVDELLEKAKFKIHPALFQKVMRLAGE